MMIYSSCMHDAGILNKPHPGTTCPTRFVAGGDLGSRFTTCFGVLEASDAEGGAKANLMGTDYIACMVYI